MNPTDYIILTITFPKNSFMKDINSSFQSYLSRFQMEYLVNDMAIDFLASNKCDNCRI